MEKKYEELIKKMTLDEKIELLNGKNSFYTTGLEKYNLRSLTLSDGPHGLRKTTTEDISQINVSVPAVCFPSSGTTINSWDEDVFKNLGNALAEECLNLGVDVILGPAVNIQRNPLCGRHFEYVSEDPLLAGTFATNYINSIQSKNVGTCIKHFATNNNENIRLFGSSYVDKRALFDIYLKPFEIAIKNANPYTVMCAYNRFNGAYLAENEYLINEVLRNKFNYDGLVMTDWGATNIRSESIRVGVDLEMPGSVKDNNKQLKNAILNKELDESYLNKSLERYLTLLDKIEVKEKTNYSLDNHHELAVDIASKSGVLLKNKGLLPLNLNEEYIVIGDLFKNSRYQGMGSSLINPYKIETVEDAFKANNIKYKYFRGYEINVEKPNKKYEDNVVFNLRPDSKVLVFLGLSDLLECEGLDRKHLRLPNSQLSLMNKILKVAKNVCVILFTGSPVELPFINDINSLLLMGLGGEGVGRATFNLLFNKVNPSGRLATTWVKKEEDIPFNKEFKTERNLFYKESIFVGYRYYSTFNKEVLFPFGYGLSYSKFIYSDYKITKDNENICVSLKIENISDIDGADVIEVYYNHLNSNYYRASKNLIGFKKVYLKAHESKTLELAIPLTNLEIYNVEEDKNLLEEGLYEVIIANNVESEIYKNTLELEGFTFKNHNLDQNAYYKKEDIKDVSDEEFFNLFDKKPEIYSGDKITIYSPFKDFKKGSLGGKLFFKIVKKS